MESRVRKMLPEGIRLSSNALEGLEDRIKELVEAAVARCKANKRKTIIKEDF